MNISGIIVNFANFNTDKRNSEILDRVERILETFTINLEREGFGPKRIPVYQQGNNNRWGRTHSGEFQLLFADILRAYKLGLGEHKYEIFRELSSPKIPEDMSEYGSTGLQQRP